MEKTHNYVRIAAALLVIGAVLFASSTVYAKSKQMNTREMQAAIIELQQQVILLQKQVDQLNKEAGISPITATTTEPTITSGKNSKSATPPCVIPRYIGSPGKPYAQCP